MQLNFTFAILIVAAYVAGAQSASCLAQVASFAKLPEAQATCLSFLNLTEADIPKGKDLKEKHFNDRCLASCVMESVNFYTNGTIKKDAILEALREEVTTDVYNKLASTVETCVEKANSKPQKKDKDDKERRSTSSPRTREMDSGSSPRTREMDNGSSPRTREWKLHHHGNTTCPCKRAAKFLYCMLEKDKEADC